MIPTRIVIVDLNAKGKGNMRKASMRTLRRAPAKPGRAAAKPKRLGGRPTPAVAAQRHAAMLEKALDLFLDRGFEQTTLEAIAASLGMTKRTIYARYADKAALFKAAVAQAIERWIMPHDKLNALQTDDLEGTLLGIARIRIAHVLAPEGLRMQRILNSESYRFPEIMMSAYDKSSRPVIEFLADILARHHAKGAIAVDDATLAATVFLGMVVGGPTRKITAGMPPNAKEIDARVRYSVRLFLDGVRPRHRDAYQYQSQTLASQTLTSLTNDYPIGEVWVFDIGVAEIEHRFIAADTMEYCILTGPRAGEVDQVSIEIVAVRSGVYFVSWQEADNSTVVHLEDFTQGTFLSCFTSPQAEFMRISGRMRRCRSLYAPANSDAQ
jgi:AcrR family transcriptional regulator